MLGRRDTHLGLVDLSSGSEHAVGGESPRPRRDSDAAVFAVQEGSRGAFGLPPNVHTCALLPIGYPMGRFGPVRRVPLADVVYERSMGPEYRDLQPATCPFFK
jgi:hypothetical protein